MESKKVIILGATGSIGKAALDVIEYLNRQYENNQYNKEAANHHEWAGYIKVTGLSAHSKENDLLETGHRFNVSNLCLSGKTKTSQDIHFQGSAGLQELIKETEADLVIHGIAGSAGLRPSVTALEHGKNLALANKETIVMAGHIIEKLAQKNNRDIIPVDSEHSALFHLLHEFPAKKVREVILTASGGAFRETPLEHFSKLTVKEALKHPTWNMGPKITIDSATMGNKGLEIIEAYRLFKFDPEHIKVVIHPQSMIHSLIRTIDGSLYAQISKPDMRLPIQSAITYPKMAKSAYCSLELTDLTLSFYHPDPHRYPLLYTAYKAVKMGDGAMIAYNAGNEIAVEYFMQGAITFPQIARLVGYVLEEVWPNLIGSIDEVERIDQCARDKARHIGKILYEEN